jgi:hypothetical protein
MGTGSFSGVKRPGRGLITYPHLAPKLKKEYSYTSSPPQGLVACSRVDRIFTSTFNWRIFMNRETVKVLAYPCVYVCDTRTHTHARARTYRDRGSSLPKGILPFAYKSVFSEQKCNTTQSGAWRSNFRSYHKRCCVYFIQLWVISENIWPSAVGSRFAWKLHWTMRNLRLKNEIDKTWNALQ